MDQRPLVARFRSRFEAVTAMIILVIILVKHRLSLAINLLQQGTCFCWFFYDIMQYTHGQNEMELHHAQYACVTARSEKKNQQRKYFYEFLL